MLRFPLRLARDLARARLARQLRGDSGAAAILVLRPLEQVLPSVARAGDVSAEKNPGTELLARVRDRSASVVWIGGADPLAHSEIGQLTRCIAGHGQHVFLETNGTLLRRRIHEFRPVSRLFLTVRLDGLERSHNLRAGRGDAFQLALEGIRAAKLSGFLVCVHAPIDVRTDLGEIAELLRFAEATEVDGFLVTRAAQSLEIEKPDHGALERKTVEARNLIRNRWWEFFSRLVEKALNREQHSAQSAAPTRSVTEEADTSEEGVRVA